MDNEQTLFTSAAVLDLLAQIDELKDKEVYLVETSTGFNVNIGDSTYNIQAESPIEIEVDTETIDEIADGTIDAYIDMAEDNKISLEEHEFDNTVEGGPIKSLLKTLFIGGLVKMGSKAIGKDIAKGMFEEAGRRR